MKLPTDAELKSLPNDGGDHFNRLVFENSLYLRQHAHQAIRWYPWGQAAFELAKITNKLIFLSIGYSSSHWCHVMRDTTFSHPDVAKKLNDHFVAIKIDRDELPDIDQVYMAATQLLNQHGGWPNSVFCLPTGQPFHAGMYFPPLDDGQTKGFLSVLDQVAGAWTHQSDEVKAQGKELERVIIKMNSLQKDPFEQLKSKMAYDRFLANIHHRFDAQHGGFGDAPKFPPFATLRLLLSDGSSEALSMVETTLMAMAKGGLYDHVDGGFYRYCLDEQWRNPQFEKVLQDNAQMIELYSLMHQCQPNSLYEQIVQQTIQHLTSSWQNDDGLFIAAINPDRQSTSAELIKDTRVIISANALLVIGLVQAATTFRQDDWLVLAKKVCKALVQRVMDQLDMVYVDDVVYVLQASLSCDSNKSQLDALWGVLMQRFYDHGQGGLWFSQEAHRTPISRIKDAYDRTEPAPNARFISSAIQMSQRFDQSEYLEKAIHSIESFFPAIIQAQHGCDSFWLAIREFWASLAEPDSRVQVQFSVARWLGDDFWDVVVDLHVSDYLLVDDHVQVRNVDSFEWIDLKVDPVKTRRFQFEERPLSCATGTVRLAGKLRMTPLSPKVELLCRVCSKDGCFDPQKIKVPLVGQNDNVPGGGHIDQ